MLIGGDSVHIMMVPVTSMFIEVNFDRKICYRSYNFDKLFFFFPVEVITSINILTSIRHIYINTKGKDKKHDRHIIIFYRSLKKFGAEKRVR
jgi:hypothetical protein